MPSYSRLSPALRRLLVRLQKFEDIVRAGAGSIDGVRFDFLHSDIPLDTWFAPEFQSWYQPGVGCEGSPALFPENNLVFPWSGSSPSLNGVQVGVLRGDKICISEVNAIFNGHLFEHEVDREIREAFFELRRKNGEIVALPTPISFFRKGSFLARGFSGVNWLENIRRRVAGDFMQDGALGNSDSVLPGGDEAADGARLLKRAEKLATNVSRLVEMIEQPIADELLTSFRAIGLGLRRPSKGAEITAFDLRTMVDAAVALGFSWARYEAELNMRPHAEFGLAWRQGAAKGGKGRAARAAEDAERSKAHTLELALHLRQKDSSLSQDKLVEEILFSWKLGDETSRTAPTLKKYISEFENAGKLPRRKGK